MFVNFTTYYLFPNSDHTEFKEHLSVNYLIYWILLRKCIYITSISYIKTKLIFKYFLNTNFLMNFFYQKENYKVRKWKHTF